MLEKPIQPLAPFLVIRHGRTDWNDQQRFQGRADIPLNANGLLQAHEAAGKFSNTRPDLVVSSPLDRARTTAGIIAKRLVIDVEIEQDLIECDFGCLDGRPIPEVMREHGIQRKEELAEILPPDGENWAQVKARSIRCLSRWQAGNERKLILFVSHDAVIQSLAEQISGQWFECHHCEPYMFDRASAGWRIAAL